MASHLPDTIAWEPHGLVSIGGGGDGADAAVHSKMVGGINRVGFGHFDCLEEEPVLAVAFEIGLTLNVFEEMLTLLTDLKVEPDPL